MNFRLPFVLILLSVAFVLPGCSDPATETKKENPIPQVKPDPNTQFSSFESFFYQESLPFDLPHTYPPSGNSLSDQMQEGFLKRTVEAFPMFRFPLTTGYTAFITAENIEGNFNYILNIFNSSNEVVAQRTVAGKEATVTIDANFAEGGSWTETRTDIGEHEGKPSVTLHTLNSDGQVIKIETPPASR